MNDPDINSVPFTNQIPVDASQIHEASWGETDIHETPKVEKIDQEMPMGEAIVHEKLMSETIVHEAPAVTNVVSSASLLNREESEQLRTRWNEIQGKFVDEPRAAVQLADGLVSEVIEKITQMFTNEHTSLESQWKQGNDVSTEDLRKALQHYRSFFNRLVV